MFTLTHLDTPPPESLKSQVLQMVVDYLGDISPVSLQPSNPLYQLYQYVVGFEVHRYLDSMDGAQAGKPELILALDADDPAVLLGFALYLPFVDDPEACALVYLAVDTGQRRRASVGPWLKRWWRAIPCRSGVRCRQRCRISARWAFSHWRRAAAGGDEYAKRGFERCGGGAGSGADLPVKEVRQIYSYLVQQNGRKAMSEAEKQRDRLLDQLARQAQDVVQQSTVRRLH